MSELTASVREYLRQLDMMAPSGLTLQQQLYNHIADTMEIVNDSSEHFSVSQEEVG